MIHTNVQKTGLRRHSVALVLATLLAPLAVAQADSWSFNLIKAPTALFEESPTGEYIRLTGGGTFDPDTGTVQASGSATVFNAEDHPAPPLGPTLKGNWVATGIVSFTPDEGSNPGHLGGTLVLTVHFSLALGAIQPNAILTIMEDGIDVTAFGPDGEEFFALPGGGALFHHHGEAEAL
jgi:hypothetical protein